MDSGLSIGASTGVSVSTLRTDIGIARSTAAAAPVATELPPTQAVQATGQAASANAGRTFVPFTQPLDGSSLVHDVAFDQTTHTLVYSSVDPLTGYVVNQFPDKLVLRQKAYVRQLLDNAQGPGQGKLA